MQTPSTSKMSMTFTVKSQSLVQLWQEIERIKAEFNVFIEIQENADDKELTWVMVNGQRQKEAKDYITSFCNPECTQVLVCPEIFGEFLEDTRRKLEVNYEVVCRIIDDLSIEVCGSVLNVTLASSAFEEIIVQFDDNVAKATNKNHEDIIDSHLCSFALNEEWQGLDAETSISLPPNVKRALLSVLSEEPVDKGDKLIDGRNAALGEVHHSIDVTDDDEIVFDASGLCSTVKKKPKTNMSSNSMTERFPEKNVSLDGSYIDEDESVIFLGTKRSTKAQFDESIISGNVICTPDPKKLRLDTIDTIYLDSSQSDSELPDSHQSLVQVLVDVGYEKWAIEAAQATLSIEERRDHKKVLNILQSQKNENKLKSLTLPRRIQDNMYKIKKEDVSVIDLLPDPVPDQQDLTVLSVEELEKRHQQLVNAVSVRQPKSMPAMLTPMKMKPKYCGSLPQSTPMVKLNSNQVSSTSNLPDLDITVVDSGKIKISETKGNNQNSDSVDVDCIGELKVRTTATRVPVKPPAEDWIYVSSSSSNSDSSTEAVRKVKITSEKSLVSAIENELVARQETNLLTQQAKLEEDLRKQQEEIKEELEKRYAEQHKQLRLDNEKLQKKQEESIKELMQMMENQKKEQLQKEEKLKKELTEKVRKDKEIKDLEIQTKKMQEALRKQEELMKKLQQQNLASMKAPSLPMESPIRIEPKVAKVASGLRPIVIDGSNVAMTHGKGKVFSCRGIALCVKYFQDRGHKEITVFLPHWRKTQEASRDKPITDRKILDDLERKEFLHFTPSRKVRGRFIVSYDDRFIVRLASMNDGVIVSNDNYRDLMSESEKWKRVIEERLLMYNIVGDIFLFPDDPLGRNGPTLDQFLQKQPLNVHEQPECTVSALPALSAFPKQIQLSRQPGQLLPHDEQLSPLIQSLAVPPQIELPNRTVDWNQENLPDHFPMLRAPVAPQIGNPRRSVIEDERWDFMDPSRRLNTGYPIRRHTVHARTEPIIRHSRPPDTRRHEPQHRNLKQDIDRRKQEIDHRKQDQIPRQQDERFEGNTDMEELTRVFEKLATIFPNKEEKIMTVLHRYPDVKDVKRYANMIKDPGILEMPAKVPQNVRTLPMYAKLKNVFPDSDSEIVKLLTKHPDVDDMNALCAMLLE
ncbi:uncharacterized protein LOC117119014 isoform X2 [Anneissia japonica]|nr:uncharacterized protein LOC117119014 isoform X2 [Anneissia japonica]XP_033119684.1 uncharacterized protein LOC117119014 isoform X2 [Anneissia japonica]XP_033119685.1 uncharacterized protein LOC117119014 isoform X2 [Anneissia japonica]